MIVASASTRFLATNIPFSLSARKPRHRCHADSTASITVARKALRSSAATRWPSSPRGHHHILVSAGCFPSHGPSAPLLEGRGREERGSTRLHFRSGTAPSASASRKRERVGGPDRRARSPRRAARGASRPTSRRRIGRGPSCRVAAKRRWAEVDPGAPIPTSTGVLGIVRTTLRLPRAPS